MWWIAATACRSIWTPPGLPPLAHELAPDETVAAIEISRNLVSGRFPSDVVKDCATNGPRFVWLAAHQRSAAVVRASLFAATECAANVDPLDLALAAAAHVDETDRRTLVAVFAAAAASVATVPADHPLVQRLVARAEGADPVVRYALLEVLDARTWSGEPAVAGVFFGALQGSEAPWLVSEALRRIRPRARGLADPAALRALALVQVNALDPGIRGRAALVLAELGSLSVAERDLLLSLLDDPHGFTRSAAAEALAIGGYTSAIHALMVRLDDIERNTWDMEPFTRLDGTSVVTHHQGSEYERVDDAYLRALAVLSAPLAEERFVYREVNLRWRDLDIIAAVRDARKWYEAHRALIPPLD